MKFQPLYFRDLESVVSANPALRNFPDGASFLITGANGLLGGAVIDLLLFLREEWSRRIVIHAAVRNEPYFRTRFSGHDGVFPVRWDFTRPADFGFPCDYIIHAGCNTHPALFAQHPADTLTGIFRGTENLLDFTAKCRGKMLFISSGEAYGFAEPPFREGEKSVVDSSDFRSCYPIGKLAAENLCTAYCHQHRIFCGIVRPCHLYGPYFRPSDSHVFAEMIQKAARGEPFQMKSEGTQKRSLCHSLDCASAVLTVFLKNRGNEIYNIAHPEPAPSIRTVAEFCAAAGNTAVEFTGCSPENSAGFSKIRNAVLEPEKLLSIGWNPVFDWKTGFAHSIELRKIQEKYQCL